MGNDGLFTVIRQDQKTIEVRIEPDGLGKMDIRLSMDKGHISAHINASESIGKEVIEGNLRNIVSKLAGDGINVGSLSVSLRNGNRHGRGDRDGDGPPAPVEKKIQLQGFNQALNAPSGREGHGGTGLLSLFA